jgi:hypothetical protein
VLVVTLQVRFLASDGTLLAWAEVTAEAHGDQCLWPQGPMLIVPDETGDVAEIAVSWPDLHVTQRSPLLPQLSLQKDKVLSAQWPGPLLRFPTDERVLPCVTVRNAVTIHPSTGGLGVRG